MSKGRGVRLNLTLLVASTIFCPVVAEAALRFSPVMSGLHALPVSKVLFFVLAPTEISFIRAIGLPAAMF
jgi:hypothetical protein